MEELEEIISTTDIPEDEGTSAVVITDEPTQTQRRKGFVKFADKVDAKDSDDASKQGSEDASETGVSRQSVDLGYMRDRIRSKFKNMVEKEGRQETVKRRLSQLKLQKSVRAEASCDEEDSDQLIEEAVQRSLNSRKFLKQQQPSPKYVLPTATEQYDFFTGVCNGDESGSQKWISRKTSPATPSTNQLEPGVYPIQPVKEAREFEQVNVLPTHHVPAETVNHFKQLRAEADLYFNPSFMPVPKHLKLQNRNERRLAEEGLYVGEKQELPSRNINIMEQRLLKAHNAGEWFDVGGNILASAPPLAKFQSRPELPDETYRVADYKPAVVGRKRIGDGEGMFQLDVDLSKIVFTHHSLFSIENVLSMRLMQQYKSYLQRVEENLASYYNHRLHGLKMAAKQLHETLQQNAETGVSVDPITLNTLNRYHKEICETRKLRNREESLDRFSLRQMLQIWNAIKAIRERQGFSCTSIQLYLKRANVANPEEDEQQWRKDLEEELEEMEIAFSIEYDKQMSEYEQKLKAYKSREAKRSASKKRSTAGQLVPPPVSDTGAIENQNAEPERDPDSEPEPKRPELLDREALWTQICQSAEKNRRRPGEAILTPFLGGSAATTAAEQCPPSERKRRDDITRNKVYAKVYFNGLEVCTSSIRPLNADFCCTFGQIFNLHIYDWPQSIQLKIFSYAGSGGWVQLAEVGLPVPSVSQITTAGVKTLEEYEFSSDVIQLPLNGAVGSGAVVDFGLPEMPSIIPRTSGIVQASVLWGRSKDGTPLVPPVKNYKSEFRENLANLSVKNLEALRGLKDMLEKSKFDPNDPVNSHLLSLLKAVESNAISTDESSKQVLEPVFRLEPPELQLVSEGELKLNPRLRLLGLRNRQLTEFRNMRMVPSHAKDIPADVFKPYEQRTSRERERAEVRDMDGYRAMVNKYISFVRSEIVERMESSGHTRAFQDVINEEVIKFAALTIAMCPTEWDRPLRPLRRERKKLTAHAVGGGVGLHLNVLVNVVRANNLPSRLDRRDLSQLSAKEKELAEPFVEITFQRQTIRTSVLSGTNPTWNQEITLEFSAEDYSSGSLQLVTDLIYFNVFDQVSSDLPKDSREGSSTVYKQIEKRWLGSYKIPFSTVYFNGRIFGSFRLQMPPLLLGYKTEAISDIDAPHLQMFLAVDPPLLPAEPLKPNDLESIESVDLRSYAFHWSADLEMRFSTRRFLPLVVDTNGRTVFVSRFLRPILPPLDVENLFTTNPADAVKLACRIVSMIPFIAEPGRCDIWSTCDQFLNLLCGDEEEHAVLLACWFLGLKLDCILLLGNGLPEGPRSAYVLARLPLPQGPTLFNASTGLSYAVGDSLCPLISVGCAVTPDNVYANIQNAEHPCRLSFELTNLTYWKPFFHRNYSNPNLLSIQPEALNYTDPVKEQVEQLRARLEGTIRTRIGNWRPHTITRWSGHISQIFRQLLPSLEVNFLATDHEQNHYETLRALMESYKITGFPLNLPFTTTSDLVEAVYATRIHDNINSAVEFALAVHIHAYSNSIMSVWIYVASVIESR